MQLQLEKSRKCDKSMNWISRQDRRKGVLKCGHLSTIPPDCWPVQPGRPPCICDYHKSSSCTSLEETPCDCERGSGQVTEEDPRSHKRTVLHEQKEHPWGWTQHPVHVQNPSSPARPPDTDFKFSDQRFNKGIVLLVSLLLFQG
jgi:hypothetical protein